MGEKDVFGSPGAHDATAAFDEMVEEAGQEHAAMFKEAREKVLNRPLGSKKVSSQDQVQEYQIIKGMALEGNPQPGIDFLTAQDATLEEAINWGFEMESKLRRA